jgi:sulfur relay protein TusB/DsrH
MATLYLITKSPFEHSDSKEAIKTAIIQKEIDDKVGIVFLQNAVLGVRKEQISDGDENIEDLLIYALTHKIKLYALEADIQARAIEKGSVVSDIEVIDYMRLIDIIMDEYEKIVSWT